MTDHEIYAQRRAKWQEYLRSGKFEQGHFELVKQFKDKEDPDPLFHYCCLGVGCQLFHDETGLGSWEERQGTIFFHLKGEDREYSFQSMPQKILEWFGLDTTDQILIDMFDQSPQTILILCNDKGRMNFREIANMIEWVCAPEKYANELHNLWLHINMQGS